MERFFGGNPMAVLIRLAIISIIIGLVLSQLGYDPRELLDALPRLIEAILDFGFGWVENVARWFLLGAVIVIPVWLLIRLLRFIVGDNKGDAKPPSGK